MNSVFEITLDGPMDAYECLAYQGHWCEYCGEENGGCMFCYNCGKKASSEHDTFTNRICENQKNMSEFVDNVDFYVRQYLTEKLRLEDYDFNNYEGDDDYDTWFVFVFLQETLDEWRSGGYNFYYDMDINKINITAQELCEMLKYIQKVERSAFGNSSDIDIEFEVMDIVNTFVFHYAARKDISYWTI